MQKNKKRIPIAIGRAFLGALHKAVAGLLFSAEKVECNFEGREVARPTAYNNPDTGAALATQR